MNSGTILTLEALDHLNRDCTYAVA
jgi:hypothetical protein